VPLRPEFFLFSDKVPHPLVVIRVTLVDLAFPSLKKSESLSFPPFDGFLASPSPLRLETPLPSSPLFHPLIFLAGRRVIFPFPFAGLQRLCPWSPKESKNSESTIPFLVGWSLSLAGPRSRVGDPTPPFFFTTWASSPFFGVFLL